MEDSVRAARRAAVAARHVTEDATAEAVLNIRRHPIRAVGIAAGAGILVGFGAACFARR
jgi:ElaB/YqjD/DUF883 family membrane-anchored ribosome-binding protein